MPVTGCNDPQKSGGQKYSDLVNEQGADSGTLDYVQAANRSERRIVA